MFFDNEKYLKNTSKLIISLNFEYNRLTILYIYIKIINIFLNMID